MNNNYVNEQYVGDFYYRVKYISGMNASKSAVGRYHPSNDLMFIYYSKGGGVIKIEGKRYDISDGDIILLKPSEFFLHVIDDKIYHERIVLITNTKLLKGLYGNLSYFSPFFQRENGEKNLIPSDIVKKHGIDKQFFELLKRAQSQTEVDKILTFSMILEIIGAIHKTMDQNTVKSHKSSVTDRIIDYIDKNFTKDISIDDIAYYMKFDRSYLAHFFKEQVGISLWNYVILKRIYMFNSLISDSDSVEEVAFKSGFKNYSNFFRLYKKHMGITPAEFKKQL